MGGFLVTFGDGPAANQSLDLQRAPHFLRAVCGVDGKWDALDQLDDDPALGETIHVYRLVRGSAGHICMRPGGCYTTVTYRHTTLIDPAGMEDRERWRAAVEAVCRDLDRGPQPDPVDAEPAGREHLHLVEPPA